MKLTSNYNLKKPDGADAVNIQDFNDNADKIDAEIVKKVDKVSGKNLSTNDYTTAEKTKLAGIADNANNYVHPAAHPATIITQDTTHRFITDIERTKLSNVQEGATKYVHPVTHPPSIIVQDTNNRFTTDKEKTTWNSKADMAAVAFPTMVNMSTQIDANDTITQTDGLGNICVTKTLQNGDIEERLTRTDGIVITKTTHISADGKNITEVVR